MAHSGSLPRLPLQAAGGTALGLGAMAATTWLLAAGGSGFDAREPIGPLLLGAGSAAMAGIGCRHLGRWWRTLLGVLAAMGGLAVAVTAGWIPPAYLEVAAPSAAAGALGAAIAGSFLASAPLRLGLAAAFLVTPFAGAVPPVDGGAPEYRVTTRVLRAYPVSAPDLFEAILAVDRADTVNAPAHLEQSEYAWYLYRAVTGPATFRVPRGLAAWRGAARQGVLLDAVTYELAPRGDSTDLVVRGTARDPLHWRLLRREWLQRTAAALVEARLRAIDSVVADGAAGRVTLTAEMRALRQALAGRAGYIGGDGRAVPLPADTSAAGVAGLARTVGWQEGQAHHFEDLYGRCYEVRAERVTRCVQRVMGARSARSRPLRQVAWAGGTPEDRWSVVPIIRAVVRVFPDSFVVSADSLALLGGLPDAAVPVVDSVTVGVSVESDRAWYILRRGTALGPAVALAPGQQWVRRRVRLTIPVDSTVRLDLDQAWPTLEVKLSVPRTADNPYGTAWTYSHGKKGLLGGTGGGDGREADRGVEAGGRVKFTGQVRRWGKQPGRRGTWRV